MSAAAPSNVANASASIDIEESLVDALKTGLPRTSSDDDFTKFVVDWMKPRAGVLSSTAFSEAVCRPSEDHGGYTALLWLAKEGKGYAMKELIATPKDSRCGGFFYNHAGGEAVAKLVSVASTFGETALRIVCEKGKRAYEIEHVYLVELLCEASTADPRGFQCGLALQDITAALQLAPSKRCIKSLENYYNPNACEHRQDRKSLESGAWRRDRDRDRNRNISNRNGGGGPSGADRAPVPRRQPEVQKNNVLWRTPHSASANSASPLHKTKRKKSNPSAPPSSSSARRGSVGVVAAESSSEQQELAIRLLRKKVQTLKEDNKKLKNKNDRLLKHIISHDSAKQEIRKLRQMLAKSQKTINEKDDALHKLTLDNINLKDIVREQKNRIEYYKGGSVGNSSNAASSADSSDAAHSSSRKKRKKVRFVEH